MGNNMILTAKAIGKKYTYFISGPYKSLKTIKSRKERY